ncbi:FecR domain-containing protein [Microbacterium sp. NPDC056569]|uniref:FecR family protein n=1 Tax=Microbacterium sp. NPDC056569 TaxID=3345867 RepID=UPI00366D7187
MQECASAALLKGAHGIEERVHGEHAGDGDQSEGENRQRRVPLQCVDHDLPSVSIDGDSRHRKHPARRGSGSAVAATDTLSRSRHSRQREWLCARTPSGRSGVALCCAAIAASLRPLGGSARRHDSGGGAMRTTAFSSAAMAVAVCLAMTGCASAPAATVDPLQTQVQLAAGDADPRDLEEQSGAAQGDVISTDAAGLAEVVFPDSSFMRVGPSSEVEITELGAEEAQRTSISLDIGETWHNVQELVSDEAVYEVVTPVGTASVRGTVFSVVCVEGPSCEFIVFEGELEVEGDDGTVTVDPYERVVIPGAQPEPSTIPADALPDWATENIARDGESDDAVALPDPPLEAAALSGDEWAILITKLEGDASSDPPGAQVSVTWTISEPECDNAVCTSTWVSSSGSTGSLSRSGTVITGERVLDPLPCIDSVTGEVLAEGVAERTISYELTITGAEERDGIWAATQIAGEQRELVFVPPELRALCRDLPPDEAEKEDLRSVEMTR